MIELRDKATGQHVGALTETQFKFLVEQLEEEYEGDTDYYIDGVTLEMLEGKGADPKLITMLRDALGARPEMEIEWSRTGEDNG